MSEQEKPTAVTLPGAVSELTEIWEGWRHLYEPATSPSGNAFFRLKDARTEAREAKPAAQAVEPSETRLDGMSDSEKREFIAAKGLDAYRAILARESERRREEARLRTLRGGK